jgi:hypothetical protein
MAPCTATSHRARAARRARAPTALGVHAAPRPRPHASQGAPSPHARASRRLGVRPAAPPRPRRTGQVRATDRQSDGSAPAVRAPAEGQYHGEHLAPSPFFTSASVTIKTGPLSPSPRATALPILPLPPPPVTAFPGRPFSSPSPLASSLSSTRRPRFICCPPRVVVSPELAPPR